jgi:hypothetical protein
MPNQPKTQHRSIRVPDDLWHAALVRAADEGTTVAEKVRTWLQEWLAEQPR